MFLFLCDRDSSWFCAYNKKNEDNKYYSDLFGRVWICRKKSKRKKRQTKGKLVIPRSDESDDEPFE